MYGIPNMKLDKKVVERKIKVMEEEGIRFVPNADIGKNVKADKLLKEFDRVVLACGSADPRDINVPGRDADGIYFAVDFLGRNTKSLLDSGFKDKKYVDTKDRHVIIIGGGDTGNDCVASRTFSEPAASLLIIRPEASFSQTNRTVLTPFNLPLLSLINSFTVDS